MAQDGAHLFEELMRFRPEGMTANAWAVSAGVSRTIWADLKRHGNPSRRTLEKLLVAAGMTLAEFEALRVGQLAPSASGDEMGLAERGREWRGAPPTPIPLFATSLVGEWGEPRSGIDVHSLDRSRTVGRLDRPAALAADGGAYAITVAGASMWPRFRAGRQLLVSPATSVAIGDDVLVELVGGKWLVKELVGRSASLVELRQFNPDATFQVKASEIEAIHKIAGEAI